MWAVTLNGELLTHRRPIACAPRFPFPRICDAFGTSKRPSCCVWGPTDRAPLSFQRVGIPAVYCKGEGSQAHNLAYSFSSTRFRVLLLFYVTLCLWLYGCFQSLTWCELLHCLLPRCSLLSTRFCIMSRCFQEWSLSPARLCSSAAFPLLQESDSQGAHPSTCM